MEDEIVEAIEVPLPQSGQRFRTWKVSKHCDSDISAVCAAFRIALDGGRNTDCRVAFGGVAATPKRAADYGVNPPLDAPATPEAILDALGAPRKDAALASAEGLAEPAG